MQQESDPKHTRRSTSEWLTKEKQIKVLEVLSQSLDLNPTEMLRYDLKRAFHARKTYNVAEIKQFCKEEWANIPLVGVNDDWSFCAHGDTTGWQVPFHR